MNIREIILTPESVKYKDLAKRELFVLEAQRVTAGQIAKRKVFQIEGVFALLYTSRMTKKIIMWGGRGPQIFLTNYTDAWAYDYYSDAVSNAAFAEAVATALPANPLYNGRNQVGDLIQSTYSQGWTSEIIGNPYLFLGGINAYEMGVFHEGSEIYGRVADTIGHIATVPDTFLPDFSKPYGSLFGLSAYKDLPAWNLFRGLILYTLNPANQNLQDSWYWTPSFFAAESANAFGLIVGFYYGNFPNQEYGTTGTPLTSAAVSFKALLDTRVTSGAYNYGWAEIVKEIDGVAVNDVHFYLQADPLAVPSNPNFASLLVTTTTSNPLITTGSLVRGFESSFSVSVDSSDVEVDFWNFNRYINPDSIIPDQDTGVCAALISGQAAQFVRFTGFKNTVYETTTYHSHSTSRDGTILAVFESNDGNLIHRVRVFDLFGTREPTDGSEYTSGNFTELRASDVVASVEALTGCIIPYRADGFTPSVLEYDLATATPTVFSGSDYTDYLPSLSRLRFKKEASGSLEILKVVCTNGIDATYGQSTDDCFSSTVIIEDPESSTAEEKLIGEWNEGGTIKGKIRGAFTGGHPNMRFAGVGTGETITLPNEFAISTDELTGIVTFGDYVGALTLGSCVEEDGVGGYKLEAGCSSDCGSLTVSASSSCGQTASETITGTTPATLALSGSTDPIVGDVYVASGGVAPYVYTSSDAINFVIDSSTGEVTSMTYCANYTITVTDACGSTDTITTNYSYGSPTTIVSGARDDTDWRCASWASGQWYAPNEIETYFTTSGQLLVRVYSPGMVDGSRGRSSYSIAPAYHSADTTCLHIITFGAITCGPKQDASNYPLWRFYYDIIERCLCVP